MQSTNGTLVKPYNTKIVELNSTVSKSKIFLHIPIASKDCLTSWIMQKIKIRMAVFSHFFKSKMSSQNMENAVDKMNFLIIRFDTLQMIAIVSA